MQPSPIDPCRLAEVNLLVKHLRFWGEAMSALINHEVMVDLTVIDDALGERIRDTVQPQLRALHLRDSPGRTRASATTGPQRSRSSSVPTTALNQNSETAAFTA